MLSDNESFVFETFFIAITGTAFYIALAYYFFDSFKKHALELFYAFALVYLFVGIVGLLWARFTSIFGIVSHFPAPGLPRTSPTAGSLGSDREAAKIDGGNPDVRSELSWSHLTSESFSDCTIKCQDRTWKVHKFVLCPQSPYFRAAFQGSFKEAVQGNIDLSMENPKSLSFVIDWLYGRYRPCYDKVSYDDCAPLYTLARKFGIDRLAEGVAWRYKQHANTKATADVEEVLSTLEEQAKEIFCGTVSGDRGLRDPLVELVLHKLRFVKTEEHRGLLRQALCTSESFACEITMKLVEALPKP